MEFIFFFSTLLSLICLIIGVIYPKAFARYFKRDVVTRGYLAKLFSVATVLSFIALAIVVPPVEPELNQEQTKNSPTAEVSEQQDTEQLASSTIVTSTQSDVATDTTSTDITVQVAEPTLQETEPASNNTPTERQETFSEQPTQTEPTPPKTETEPTYKVTSVVDGDTIKVSIDGTIETIRLIGVDTPETVHPTKEVECFGREASNYTKSLTGQYVRLEADLTQGDRGIYGRLIRYVFLADGTNFNDAIIRNGYAYEYTYNTPYQYQSQFKQAQQEAENNKRGLWADGVCEDYSAPSTASENTNEENTPSTDEPTASGPYKFYVSSHWSSRFYYCETDEDWKNLSEKYLEVYPSEEELLKRYSDHTLHQPC